MNGSRWSQGARGLAVAALSLGLFLPAVPAEATGFTVNSSADSVDVNPGNGMCAAANGRCTLRAAIQEANAHAGADGITVPAGTYVLTLFDTAIPSEDAAASGGLDVTESLTITGAGSAKTIVDGNATDRVFDVRGTPTIVEFIDLTVRNGRVNEEPFGDTQQDEGGGIRTAGNLTVMGVTVSGNAARCADQCGGAGGGIFSSGTLTLLSSTVTHNDTTRGGGIWSSGNLTVTNSNITDNEGFRVEAEVGTGGGILSSGPLSIDNTLLSGNSSGLGGALYNSGNTAAVARSTFSDNTGGGSRFGLPSGAIMNEGGGQLTLTDVRITRNTSFGDGGGVANSNGATLTIVRSTLDNNAASGNFNEDNCCGDGGGLWNESGATATIVNSTFSGNMAKHSGGGLAVKGGSVNLNNVTLALNAADSDGDGAGDGGGLANLGGALGMRNTLVGVNADAGGEALECSGTIQSGGYNLVQHAADCSLTGTVTGNLIGMAPNLGPLQLNGGLTPNRALLLGSPAIDAGNPAAPGGSGTACEADDQRGVARPQGPRCDIGAYEAAPVTAWDAFGRSASGGWGSADKGGAYSRYDGEAADYAVSAGVGTVRLASTGARRGQMLAGLSVRDLDVTYLAKLDALPQTEIAWTGLVARFQQDRSYYLARLRFDPNGRVYLVGIRYDQRAATRLAPLVGIQRAQGAEAGETLAPQVKVAANNYVNVRVQVTGANPTTVRMKAWQDGSLEPAEWQYEATDPTDIRQPGALGLWAYLDPGASSGPITASFDDLHVSQVAQRPS